MRFRFVLIIILFVFSTVNGQEYSKKELNYKPVNLEEAVEQLKKIHHDTTRQKILSMAEEEFIAGSHFGLGMWMRNNWGLWKGKDLAGYFNSIGIFHPDDMSGIILTSYYRELQDKDWELNKQIKYYQDYWQEVNEHSHKLKTDTAYQNKIKAQHDSIEDARLRQKQLEWTPGAKVSGYLGYQCGFIDLGEATKVEGTIIEWKDNKLLLYIDNYVEEKKKKRVIKCNKIIDDKVLVESHDLFRLIK